MFDDNYTDEIGHNSDARSAGPRNSLGKGGSKQSQGGKFGLPKDTTEYDEDFDNEEEEAQFKESAQQFQQKLNDLKHKQESEPVRFGGMKNRTEVPQAATKAHSQFGDKRLGRTNQTRVSQQQRLNNVNQGGRKLVNKGDVSIDNVSSYNLTNAQRSPGGNQLETRSQQLASPTMLKTIQARGAQKKKNKADEQGQNNPFKFIESALTEAKQKIEKMKQTPQILENLPDNEKKKKFLKAENKLLRENLKRMSDNVNILIEKMNQESLRKKKAGAYNVQVGSQTNQAIHDGGGEVPIDNEGTSIRGGDNRSVTGRGGHSPARSQGGQFKGAMSVNGGGSVAEQSVINTDKAILNLMKEHNRLKRRLEVVQQPDFLVNLKRDLRTTEEEIKQQEKLKRQLKVDQLKREKKLDNIMDQNEPDVLKQVQDTTQRLAYLTEKLAKIEEENQKAEILRNKQLEQLEELRTRLTKLNTIAEHYGVSIEKSKENLLEHKKLTEQLEHLNKQKRILSQAIDTQTRKQESLTNEKKRDLEQLQMRKIEILQKYNDRVRELREKGLQIRDLIERAKSEADVGLHDILDKWEQANERILQKYPDGGEMDFSLLDDQNEAPEAKGGYAAPLKDRGHAHDHKKQPKFQAKTNQPRDDEMQNYLFEIRAKQEELDKKLKQSEIDSKKQIQAEQKFQREMEMDAKRAGQDRRQRDLAAKKLAEEKQKKEQDQKRQKEAAAKYKTAGKGPQQARQPSNSQAKDTSEIEMLKAQLEQERQQKEEIAKNLQSEQERRLNQQQQEAEERERQLREQNQSMQQKLEEAERAAQEKQHLIEEEKARFEADMKQQIQQEAKSQNKKKEKIESTGPDYGKKQQTQDSAQYEGGAETTILQTDRNSLNQEEIFAGGVPELEEEEGIEESIQFKSEHKEEQDPSSKSLSLKDQIEEAARRSATSAIYEPKPVTPEQEAEIEEPFKPGTPATPADRPATRDQPVDEVIKCAPEAAFGDLAEVKQPEFPAPEVVVQEEDTITNFVKPVVSTKPSFGLGSKPNFGAASKPMSFLERQRLAKANQRQGGGGSSFGPSPDLPAASRQEGTNAGVVYPTGQVSEKTIETLKTIEDEQKKSIVRPTAEEKPPTGIVFPKSSIDAAPLVYPGGANKKVVEEKKMETPVAVPSDQPYVPTMGSRRRPRPGATDESENNQSKTSLNASGTNRLSAADPFAKYDSYDPTKRVAAQKPMQTIIPSKPVEPIKEVVKPAATLDDLLGKIVDHDTDKIPTFLDQLNNKQPEQIKKPELKMKMAAPTIAPKAQKKVLVADLDDLEDLC